MASALPIIAVGAGVLLLAGGKKKRRKAAAYEEPPVAPGAGGLILRAVPATLDSPETQKALLVARKAQPVERPKEEIEKVKKEVEKEEKEPAPPTPPRCPLGTLSPNKKHVCWGPGKLRKMRRIPKYRTAQMTAAALHALGPGAGTALKELHIQFLLWCWVNRNKGLYKCYKRRKLGRKTWCSKWARY